MSSSDFQLCPSCGTPVTSGAAFCENCGAELPTGPQDMAPPPEAVATDEGQTETLPPPNGGVAAEAGRSAPALVAEAGSVPEVRTAPMPALVSSPVQNSLRSAPPPAVFAAAPRPSTFDEDAPFVLEWDERRAFIEGVRCNFSFRIRCLTRMAQFGLCAEVDGGEPFCVRYSDLREGDVREGLFPFVPQTPGTVSVRIAAGALYEEKGCRESFEAARPFEHFVSPLTRFLAGNQSVNIDIRDNTGLIRLDELQLPRQDITDLKLEIEKALLQRGGWVSVPMSTQSVERERARLRTASGECLVVAGSDIVTFGASASRTSVPLAAAVCRGERGRFISGVHFSLQRDHSRNELLLRDGGPSRGQPSVWRASTNDTLADGVKLTESRPLRPGDAIPLSLAPYVVSGGALSLLVEARGYGEDCLGFDCTGDVSSVLVTEQTPPGSLSRFALVIWGAAEIDSIFGTHTGIRIALIRGRLYAVYPDGTERRLVFLAGGRLPGTSIFVQ